HFLSPVGEGVGRRAGVAQRPDVFTASEPRPRTDVDGGPSFRQSHGSRRRGPPPRQDDRRARTRILPATVPPRRCATVLAATAARLPRPLERAIRPSLLDGGRCGGPPRPHAVLPGVDSPRIPARLIPVETRSMFPNRRRFLQSSLTAGGLVSWSFAAPDFL